MLPHLYSAILDRLHTTIGTAANLSATFPTAPPDLKPVQWLDYYNGQPENLRDRTPHDQYPILLPAIFIEFGTINWDSYNRRMKGIVPIRIFIVQEIYTDSHAINGTPGLNQQATLNQLLLPELVQAVLHNWRPLANATLPPSGVGSLNALQLSRSSNDGKHNNVRIDIDDYTLPVERTLPELNTPTNTPMTILPTFDIEQA